MKTIPSSITSKRQVTVPVAVFDRLGLDAPGRMEWVLEDDGSVRVRPVAVTVASLFGSVPALASESADLRREIAEAVAAGIERDLREKEL